MGWQPETQPKGKLPVEKMKVAETTQKLVDADDLIGWAEIVPLTDDGGIDINDFEEKLKSMPTIDAVPERTGTWTEEYDTNDDPLFRRKFRCSACHGWNTYGFTRYCPECGAKMLNATALTMEENNDKAD